MCFDFRFEQTKKIGYRDDLEFDKKRNKLISDFRRMELEKIGKAPIAESPNIKTSVDKESSNARIFNVKDSNKNILDTLSLLLFIYLLCG
jgi:hypothetical protein